jgi:hypothetical protein
MPSPSVSLSRIIIPLYVYDQVSVSATIGFPVIFTSVTLGPLVANIFPRCIRPKTPTNMSIILTMANDQNIPNI